MIKTDVNIRGTYNYYAENVDDPISVKDYIKINNMFSKFLVKLIIEGFMVSLPKGLGYLYIAGRKVKGLYNKEGKPALAPNWKKTNELWNRNKKAKKEKKIVRFTNEETNGYIYRLRWSKKRSNVVNKNFISVRLTRDNKRAIASKIKQGKEYIIIK